MLRFFLAAMIAAFTPAISWAASVSANLAITITSSGGGGGNTVQATNFCAANGGGDGSAGNPWKAACIQAAFNAASSGDTVSLAAGNWSLPTDAAPATTSKSISLVGAGSGNTFDAYGHPNNASGAAASTFPGITRIFTSGPQANPGTGGWVSFSNCSNVSVSHIFVDGSAVSSGGDIFGTLHFDSCNGITVTDIRVLAFYDAVSDPETQFYIQYSNNVTVQGSTFADPVSGIVNGGYPGSQIFQINGPTSSGILIKNNVFYENGFNPIYVDNLTYTGNLQYTITDSFAYSNIIRSAGFIAGCWNDCPLGSGLNLGVPHGDYHINVVNNYFADDSNEFSMGPAINDPSTSGAVNDTNFTGNWIVAPSGALDSCSWHLHGSCLSGQGGPGVVAGMVVNDDPSTSLTFTNNSVMATNLAQINATGTGLTQLLSPPSYTNNTVTNFHANKNYLTAATRNTLTDSATINPVITNNYGLDVNSGFNTNPTASFTLGTLSSGVVPFATTTFTAQYGAVKWLASTSPTTPTAGDGRWNYLPPVSLAAASGNTVYLWVMDSVNHISAPASATVL